MSYPNLSAFKPGETIKFWCFELKSERLNATLKAVLPAAFE